MAGGKFLDIQALIEKHKTLLVRYPLRCSSMRFLCKTHTSYGWRVLQILKKQWELYVIGCAVTQYSHLATEKLCHCHPHQAEERFKNLGTWYTRSLSLSTTSMWCMSMTKQAGKMTYTIKRANLKLVHEIQLHICFQREAKEGMDQNESANIYWSNMYL